MSEKKKSVESTLRFVNYVVDRVEFKNNPGFEGEEIAVDYEIIPNFDIRSEKRDMLVEMYVSIFKNAIENNYPFEMEIVVYGFFKMSEEENESIEKFKTNATAIMFPYIRALVTSFTASSNVTPLILPTVNINRVMKKVKN